VQNIAGQQLLTTQQVADALNVHRATVRNYAKKGIIPVVKVGPHTSRYILDDVLRALGNADYDVECASDADADIVPF